MMTVLTLDLPPDLYQRLLAEAQQRGSSVEALAELLLTETLAGTALSEQDRATAVLRAAGLLTELSPEEKARAMRATATLAEVQAALAQGSGPTLSEIVNEQRGTKG
jgi:plasmid stability protein